MKKEELQQNMKDRMQQFEDGGLRLLKKGQKGIVHAIFSRFGLVLLLMLLQVGVLWSVFRWFGGLLPHYFGGSVAMSAFMVDNVALPAPINPIERAIPPQMSPWNCPVASKLVRVPSGFC